MKHRAILAASVALGLIASSPTGAGEISQERGFSIHEVEAEAGLHPEQPAPDAEKVLTNDGHAYWLRSEPVLRGEITDVAVLHDGGQVFIGLKFTSRGAETLSKWMTRNQERSIAYVLDGEMLFSPINIMTPFPEPVKQMVLQVPGDLMAYALAAQFKRALTKAEMRGQDGV